MKILFQVFLSLCLASHTLDSSSVNAQEPNSPTQERPKSVSIPFQVRLIDSGLEVTEYTRNDDFLKPGDIIIWVNSPDLSGNGTAVYSRSSLNAEIAARQDEEGMIALWTKRGDSDPGWVLVNVARKSMTQFVELPEELGGISLLSGFQATPTRPGRHSEVWGGITGTDGMDIEYSIWPVRKGPGPRTSGDYTSDARRLPEENRQWFREQYVGGALVQVALSKSGRLVVSYPSLGINSSVEVKDKQQLADGLLILMSIPNAERGVAWTDAVKMIEQGDVKSVSQFHSGEVRIQMGSRVTYRTKQPQIDSVLDVLRRCGKYHTVGIITE